MSDTTRYCDPLTVQALLRERLYRSPNGNTQEYAFLLLYSDRDPVGAWGKEDMHYLLRSKPSRKSITKVVIDLGSNPKAEPSWHDMVAYG